MAASDGGKLVRFAPGSGLSGALLAVAMMFAPDPSRSATTRPAQVGEPLNIGVVLYTKTRTPGVLKARWSYSNVYSGPGVATGRSTAGGFAGRYHVRYYLENGAFSDEYDLEIRKHGSGGLYDLAWIADGKVSARGVGIEVSRGRSLSVGWRRVED